MPLLEMALANALLAAVPALLALAAGRWSRRPALAHGLWLVALLKLITPPLFDLPIRIVPAPQVSPAVQVPAFDEEPALAEWPAHHAAIASPAPAPALSSIDWRQALVGFWIAGSAFCGARFAWRVLRFHRMLRHARPASDDLYAQALRVAGRLGLRSTPSLWLIDGNLSPMLWAFAGRAKLLIPEALWLQLSARQQSALLAHELAHWRRGDHLVRYLEALVGIAYWWHPLAWWGILRLREAEEQCCDAWVVWAWPQAARDYAAAIVQTVDFIAEPAPALPALASGMGRVGDLVQRVRMIMKASNERKLSAAGWIVVLAAALLLPLAPRLAPADEKPEQQPAPAAEKDRPKEGDRDEARREGDREAVRRDAEGAPRAEQREGERREGDREIRRDGDRRPRPVKGTVLRFEADALVIGVGDAQREMVVPLQDQTEFFFREQKIDRADLQPGTIVEIQQADGLTAKVVGINLPRRPDARRDGEQRREGEDRPVRRDGDNQGEKPEARRDGDRPREGQRDGDRPVQRDPAGPRPVNGEVIRLEGGNLAISVGESRREMLVPIAADTRILINNQEGKLADIQPGDFVSVLQEQGLTKVISVKQRRQPARREGGER